jgi:hypothetical protein
MASRKAVIVGSLMLLGFGAVTIALFGSMLSHWYATDELWVVSQSQGGRYITYDNSPSALAYYLGIYCLGILFGGVCILAALSGAFLLARQARRNRQPK